MTIRLVLAPKTLTHVGWGAPRGTLGFPRKARLAFEERNPTNRENVGFRIASTQPTILVNTKRIELYE